MPNKNVTICLCSSRALIDTEKVADAAASLRIGGYDVTIVPDLCQKAITDKSGMQQIAESTVIACYPRAVISLFEWLDMKPKQVLDIRNNSSENILAAFNVSKVNNASKLEIPESIASTEKEAWFPILDKSRCTECGQCHDFCLFGVYSFVDGLIRVAQPQNCKNNCPACARVCPTKAIIFPKYEKSPINGGLIDEEQAVSIDSKTLYNSALKMKLDQRRASISLLKKKPE